MSAVPRELDEFLARFGFSPAGQFAARVSYSDGHRLVSLAYWPEEASPWLEIDVGIVSLAGDLGIVGLWRVLSAGCAGYEPSDWRFNSSDELLALLSRFKQELWVQCLLPALSDTAGIESALHAQRLQVESDAREAAIRQAIVIARQYLARGDVARAAEHFALVPSDRIPHVDRLRLARAQKAEGQ